jgi:hypothetical protein
MLDRPLTLIYMALWWLLGPSHKFSSCIRTVDVYMYIRTSCTNSHCMYGCYVKDQQKSNSMARTNTCKFVTVVSFHAGGASVDES